MAWTAMNDAEIRKYVGDFDSALVRLKLARTREVDTEIEAFGRKFDSIGTGLYWDDPGQLAAGGIDITWLHDIPYPHRVVMHPEFVTLDAKWEYVRHYLAISMVSDKMSKIIFPNLRKRSKPKDVDRGQLLDEAGLLNAYLRLVAESGFSGDRVISYNGDLKTHGQNQNHSGEIGAAGAVAAIWDALAEISPDAVVDTYGTMPPYANNSPESIVRRMTTAGYRKAEAILLSSRRAIVFSADPDIAIIARVDGQSYRSAQEAAEHWAELNKGTGENRNAGLYQAAVGEVKTSLDPSNKHERIALSTRTNRSPANASRFLLMAILTRSLVDASVAGETGFFSSAGHIDPVFNLYFAWGYDSARADHPEHWENFKSSIRRWTDL
jgi:hypothetical protein